MYTYYLLTPIQRLGLTPFFARVVAIETPPTFRF